MKMKWLVAVIGLVLIISIGGKLYMDSQKKVTNADQSDGDIVKAQEDIALYLTEHYEDVKKVEFREIKEIVRVGYSAWDISVIVNEDHAINFSVTDLSNIEEATIRHNPKTFKLNKKEGDTTGNLDDVQIIYWGAE